MKNILLRLLCVVILASPISPLWGSGHGDIEPSRKQLLKEWNGMKFGMFVHWGIYSVPAGVWKGEKIEKLGEQIQRHANIPHYEYAKLAQQFNPIAFDPLRMVRMAKAAGMKYIVFTAKHHDGFCMFDSKYTDFDVVDATPYKKDVLKQLAEACRQEDMKLGLYYSNPDWHFNYPNVEINPDDQKISVFGKMSKANENYEVNQLTELMSNYGDIVEVFFDMGEPTLEQSRRFVSTIRRLQPRCVVNGRVMNNQGDFITMPDNHLPDHPIDSIAWEMPGTFYHTWGYKSWVKGDTLPVQVRKQVRTLSRIASRGGNFLLNIGPKPDGTVVKYEEKVLQGIAKWMGTNGEAIHNTHPTPFVVLPWGECTLKGNKLYFHVFDWPADGKLLIPGLKSEVKKVYPLADKRARINYRMNRDGLNLDLSSCVEDSVLTVIAAEFVGKLKIQDPVVPQKCRTKIVLPGSKALHHGKYGRESYRSILKDYFRTWNVDVEYPGRYKVDIVYKMKYDEKLFVLEVESGDRLPFSLSGDATEAVRLELIDGNEVVGQKQGRKAKCKIHRKTVGKINLTKKGENTLRLMPGIEFVLTATTEEFKKQNPKYKSMGIDIERIVLSRIE